MWRKTKHLANELSNMQINDALFTHTTEKNVLFNGLQRGRLALLVEISRKHLGAAQCTNRHLGQHHHGRGVSATDGADVGQRESAAGELGLRESTLGSRLLRNERI